MIYKGSYNIIVLFSQLQDLKQAKGIIMAITIATESLIFRDPPNAIEPQLLRWVNGVCCSVSGGKC